MNEHQYRNRWLRRHKQYERIAYKQFNEGFKSIGNAIPFQFMTKDNYSEILNTSANQELFFNVYFNVYREVGLIHGERIGREINREIKDFTLNTFLSTFQRNLLNWILSNTLTRVVNVRNTYLNYIREVIAKDIQDGKEMSQIVTDIQLALNKRGFYRWQINRIVRTETTAAANYASLQAGTTSGIVLDKIWISATDSRTRTLPKNKYDHLSMNGKRVPKDKPFEVPTLTGFENIMFAGDPKGSAGNVINCRCSNALVPRRDKNGRIVRV
jgi:hypothetical protein